MKKIQKIGMAVAAILALCFVACNSPAAEETKTPEGNNGNNVGGGKNPIDVPLPANKGENPITKMLTIFDDEDAENAREKLN